MSTANKMILQWLRATERLVTDPAELRKCVDGKGMSSVFTANRILTQITPDSSYSFHQS